HDAAITALVVSPDGQWVATASCDSTIIIWDARDACVSQEWIAHVGHVQDLAFSPDSRYIASAGQDRTVAVWDISGSAHQVASLSGHEFFLRAAFSPESTHIAVGYDDGMHHVWNVATGQEPLFWQAHENVRAFNVEFSPDGRLLLSAGDKAVKTWDADTSATVQSFEGHESLVTEACFSPCGKYIASASSDETVRVWRTSDGACLATLSDHGHWVSHVSFTPDGTMLWSAARNGTVLGRRLQDVIPDEFVEDVR
ncbi:WD40 repeat-like protein, partial [Dichomitus squalens LYAD-421 SS1]